MNRSVVAFALAALLLSACGLRGELKRPGPMFGNPPLEGPNDPRVLAEKDAKAKADKDRKAAERQKEDADRAAAAASPTPTPSVSPSPAPPPSPN